MFFLYRCQSGLCAISPIWCLGLWRCIVDMEGKQTRTHLRNTCRLPSCVWRSIGRVFLHTRAHVASSSPQASFEACVRSWTCRNVWALKGMEKTVDRGERHVRPEQQVTERTLREAAVIYWSGADGVPCSFIALACLNSLGELSKSLKKNHQGLL